MRWVLAAGLCLMMPATALSSGFLTRDLGEGGHYEDCMVRALQSLQVYLDRTGAQRADVTQGDWAVYAFRLMPGAVDVQIACPYRNNIAHIVLLTTHSAGPEADRERVLVGIAGIWDALAHGGLPPAGDRK